MKRKLIMLTFTLFVAMGSHCDGPTPDPNAGFKITTLANSFGLMIPTSGEVQGILLNTTGNPTGDVTSFDVQHGGGTLVIPRAKVPGYWRLRLLPAFNGTSLCAFPVTEEPHVGLNENITLVCEARFFRYTASPDTIDALNPPATVAINGDGINTTYGTPMVAFYDEFGGVAAWVPASQIIWRKGTARGVMVSIPQLNLVYDGMYTVVVHNIRSDGSWEAVGATPVTVFGNPPPPPPPPGGGGDGDGGCTSTPDQLPCEEEPNV
jgi:hypothetical protein